jgi:hypothetical protein
MTSGRCLFSVLAVCLRDGATISHPCHSCAPAPLRTGQAAFPHPAPRQVIHDNSALRYGLKFFRILTVGQLMWARACEKPSHVYALRWLLRLSRLNRIRLTR